MPVGKYEKYFKLEGLDYYSFCCPDLQEETPKMVTRYLVVEKLWYEVTLLAVGDID